MRQAVRHLKVTEITDIRIISGGVGYTKLPTLDKTNKYNTFGQIDNTGQVYSTGVLTTNGTGAKLLPVTNTGMGGVGSFEVVNQGIEYSSAPTLNSFRHAVLKDITGTFNSNTSLTSHTGTVTEFDNDRQLISMNTTTQSCSWKYSINHNWFWCNCKYRHSNWNWTSRNIYRNIW